jgi:PAS domain S-box-containing protein
MKPDAGLPSDQDPLAFLAGDGEMPERTRAFDWSTTPVGPAADWPRSLRIAVRIMLDSRYAMWLGWGRDFTFFYNDAYARMTLGPKHPWALGRSARDVWSEIWGDIGPRAESVVRTGRATWDEGLLLFLERHGFPEETYHTFSYSPLPGDGGGVGGMLCVVTEDSERTLGERRLRTLRELAARTTEEATSAEDACQTAARTLAANPHDLPFALVYLLDEDAGSARLAGATGLPEGSPAAPRRVDLAGPGGPEAGWPLRAVLESGRAEVVAGLAKRFGPLPGRAWPEPPQQAVVLPVAKPGQTRPAGFVVAGVSPRLVLTDAYRGFLDLLAGHVATAVANARAYEAERQRAEALAELDRAKTAFFSNVSHEFRTPLTLMLGPVGELLARSHTDLTPAAAGQLEVVNRNGLRLLRLVNTLLDFSRIEAGRVRAVFQPTDLAAFTTELASVFRAAVERAGLRLVVRCPPLPEPVFVDREMWEKVVLNLLSNAFKFTFDGEIAVTLRRAGNSAELRVRDTGTGIPAEEMPRLFERFHRVRNARGRTHEGSGIGLALVHELVKLHGGKVSVESAVGEGTTFTVAVPLGSAHLPPEQIGSDRTLSSAQAGASPYVEEALRWLPEDPGKDGPLELPSGDEALPVPAVSSPAEAEDHRPCILVADDNADMRQYVVRLLAERYRVRAVPDGEAALAAVRERTPDLVLTDVMMPRLDGFGLLKALRGEAGTRGVPVIMLSARAGEESRVEGMEAGADDYLVKPFSARELLARVGAHLQMAQLRRNSEARFRQLAEAMPQIVYVTDADGKVTYVNRQWVAYTGRADAQAADLPAVMHPDDLGELLHRWGRAKATGGELQCEIRLRRAADGLYHWFLTRAVPVRDDTGRVAQWYGTSTDIHDQKRAEEELKASEKRLAAELEAMSRLHALSTRLLPADNLGDALDDLLENAILTSGADFGNIQLYNPLVGALEIVAQRGFRQDFLDYFRAVRVDEGSACAQAMQRGERIVLEDVNLDAAFEPHRPVAAAAGYRAVQSTPLKGRAGAVLGMLSTHFRAPHRPSERDERLLDLYARHAADLIERVRYEQALKDADRKKDEFLATLAHELRNPLAPLRTGLQLMRMRGGEGATADQAQAMMERQLAQLVRLVDDLLDLSRITRGKIELRKEPVELAAVVNAAVETSRPLIEEMGHELTVRVPKQPVVLQADLIRLAQVFMNLLNNAAKYTDRGGRIGLVAERQGSDVVVSVRDTGIGIPADKLTSIFEMFAQVNRSLWKAQGGLGIGLTLVRRLVEMHGGSIEARSEGLGKGAEFVVRLPILVEASAPPADGGEEPAPPKSSLRVLVVDDNRDGADSLAMMLRLMGNDTHTAYDGQEAMAAAGELRPDVVLLDVGLPGLNGYEACRRIREQPWGKGVVLVAVTGWGQEDDRRRSHDAGFDHHMVKPVDPRALMKMLAALSDVAGK